MTRALLALLCAGCLGPRVSDELPEEDDGIQPPGSTVPGPDAALEAKLEANDQVDGVVPRLTVFAGGAVAHAWDLGLAPAYAAPMFVLVRETAPDVYEPIDHPPIVSLVPGDPGYSPYRSLFYAEVTDAYRGEQITSQYGLQEAVVDGLVEAPFVAQRGVDRPIVGADVRLDAGGAAPLAPAGVAYYDGAAVPYFDLGGLALDDGVHVAELPRYVLRREGGEPLSEPIRHVDLDGDGDTADTNDVFALRPADAGYSPRRRTITVAVPPSTGSIDTSRDESVADLRDATQLFDPDPVDGTVRAFEITDEVRDLPLQRASGGL